MSQPKPVPDHGHPMMGVDNYSPSDIADLVQSRGVAKAKASLLDTLVLSILAGAFIALGAVFATVVGSQTSLGFGLSRLLMGVSFSLGLILVIVAGAELFTGNNLIVMSWAGRHISLWKLLRNWGLVYVGNLLGALSVVVMVYYADWWEQDGHQVGASAVAIANGKVNLSFEAALMRGILANALVCLAVWLAASGRSLIDKALAAIFPVTAFVAAGFEHSIANMYFIPLGLLLRDNADILQAAGPLSGELSRLTLPWMVHNLAAVTLGNIIGGGVLVGMVYWFIYLRSKGRP